MTIPRIPSHPPPNQSEWPSSRTEFQFDARRASLLVHDLQEYFLDFFEREAAPIPSLLHNVDKLLRRCRNADIPVIYSRQPTEQPAEKRGLLNTMWGQGLDTAPHRSNIESAVAPQPQDQILTKWRYSAFQRTSLLTQLKASGRNQLILCGVYAHIGCLATALEAFMYDIEVFFVADAMADFSQEQHRMALDCVANCCGTVLSTDQLIEFVLQPHQQPPAPQVSQAPCPSLAR